MALTQKKVKEVRSRLIAGKVVEILENNDLLNKAKNLGLKDWNGKKVMLQKLTPLSIEELEDLEQEITEQVNLII